MKEMQMIDKCITLVTVVFRSILLRERCTLASIVVAASVTVSGVATGQLDATWTMTIGGQSVQASPEGTFRIANVAAADQFGVAGPGTPPDFLSDDFLRVTGTSTKGGVTRYVVSRFFQIRQGQVLRINPGDLTFSDTPPPIVESINAVPDLFTLTTIGQTTQVRVTAQMSDGTQPDVSARSAFSVYRVSNRAIASVNQDGLVTGHAAGRVFITVTNQGNSAVTQVEVKPGVPTTTVVGFVEGVGGNPAAGVSVSILGSDASVLSGLDGGFTFSSVGADVNEILVTATSSTGGGVSTAVSPVPGGFTDVGLIRLVAFLPLNNGGFETGNLSGFTPQGNASVVQLLGNLEPPEGKFMAMISTGPGAPNTIGRITASHLMVPAAAKKLVFDYDFLTNEINQPPLFNDFFLARIVPLNGPPIEGVRVSRDDMRFGRVPNLPGTGGFLAQTGFREGVIDVSRFAGKMLTLDFCFLVQDVGDQIFDSATLIDNIRFLTQ